MKIKPLEAFIFSQTYNLSSETNKSTGEPNLGSGCEVSLYF